MLELGFSQFSVLSWSDGGVSATFLAGLFPSSVSEEANHVGRQCFC